MDTAWLRDADRGGMHHRYGSDFNALRDGGAVYPQFAVDRAGVVAESQIAPVSPSVDPGSLRYGGPRGDDGRDAGRRKRLQHAPDHRKRYRLVRRDLSTPNAIDDGNRDAE